MHNEAVSNGRERKNTRQVATISVTTCRFLVICLDYAVVLVAENFRLDYALAVSIASTLPHRHR